MNREKKTAHTMNESGTSVFHPRITQKVHQAPAGFFATVISRVLVCPVVSFISALGDGWLEGHVSFSGVAM